MGHIEPDDLAALALDGARAEGDTRAHLEECADCRTEYDAFVHTVELARGVSEAGVDAPPSRVWSAIHAELGLAPELADDPLGAVPHAEDRPAEPAQRGHRAAADAAPSVAPEAGSVRGAAARARGRWWPVAAAAAVVGVLVGLALGVGLAGVRTGDGVSQTVIASATLDAFPGWATSGSAVVEEDRDGFRSIVVDLDEDVPASEVREVWLIRSDASGLLSLGLLEGTSGRFAVPTGIDLDEFTLVDVSAEPVDGNPAHSGDSIVRGELRRA